MKNWKEFDGRFKRTSGVITTTIVGFILGALFLLSFSLPTLPDEPEGLLVDFGTDITGLGLIEPTSNDASAPSKQVVAEQETITQDIEESVVIPDKKVITKPKTESKTTTTTTTTVNKEELYDPNKIKNTGDKSSTSEGTSTKGGNQGDPKGDPNGYQGKGEDVGDDGSIGWSLDGRSMKAKPKLVVDHNEVGDVRIKIYVDRNGKVYKSEYERIGSTITDTYLINQSKAAALKSTFNLDKDAPETQIGYITFHFKLQ